MEVGALSPESSVSDLATLQSDRSVIRSAEPLDNAFNLILSTADLNFTLEHVQQLEKKLQDIKNSTLAQSARNAVTNASFLGKIRTDLRRASSHSTCSTQKTAKKTLFGRARYSLLQWKLAQTYQPDTLLKAKLSRKQRGSLVPEAVDLSALSQPEQGFMLLLCCAKVGPLKRTDFSAVYEKCSEQIELGEEVRVALQAMLQERRIFSTPEPERSPEPKQSGMCHQCRQAAADGNSSR